MQPMPGGNPYDGAYRAPPPPSPEPGLSAVDALGMGFGTLTKQPGSVLIAALFLLIPIVGPIALMGWQAETLRRVHARVPEPVAPLDFNGLMTHFNRGIPAFLVQLVWTMVGMCVLCIPFGVVGFGVAVLVPSMDGDAAQIAAVVLGLGGGLISLVCMFAFGLLLNGAMIRAELSEDFSTGLSFGGAMDIARRTAGKQLMAAFVFVPLASLVVLLGMVCCVVGIYPAVIVLQLAAAHYRAQVYALYLHRGGYAVPMKQPLAQPAWGYAPPPGY